MKEVSDGNSPASNSFSDPEPASVPKHSEKRRLEYLPVEIAAAHLPIPRLCVGLMTGSVKTKTWVCCEWEEQQDTFAGSGTDIVSMQATSLFGESFTPSGSPEGFCLTGLVKFHTRAYDLVSITLLNPKKKRQTLMAATLSVVVSREIAAPGTKGEEELARRFAGCQSIMRTHPSTTFLWTSFQFSLSPSVPICGFRLWRETPATLTPLHTGTGRNKETCFDTPRAEATSAAQRRASGWQEVLFLETLSYRSSLRALRLSSRGSLKGGDSASLPWGGGNGQSPGWCRSQWRGGGGNRLASRPRRSGCPLQQTEDRGSQARSADGPGLPPLAPHLGWRPPSGCSWDCIWLCLGWWTWRCWRCAEPGWDGSRPPAGGLRPSPPPPWN